MLTKPKFPKIKMNYCIYNRMMVSYLAHFEIPYDFKKSIQFTMFIIACKTQTQLTTSKMHINYKLLGLSLKI